MVYDLFTFNGEYDMLEIRFNILDPYVDYFLICEGSETFSGNAKPLYWSTRDKERFKKWERKVVYKVITEEVEKDVLKQLQERTYVDQPSFKRAFYQKEMLRKMLEFMVREFGRPNDEDIIYYGDVDEVWKPKEVDDRVHKLRQIAYSYYLNNRSPEDWRGTVVTKYKNVKGGCLNDMRANPVEEDVLENGGWHFTNLGGLDAILHKLESYDHQEVNIPWVKDGLGERIRNNVDFLGRDRDWKGNAFHMWVDESELPPYILENKDKYKHLWKS